MKRVTLRAYITDEKGDSLVADYNSFLDDGTLVAVDGHPLVEVSPEVRPDGTATLCVSEGLAQFIVQWVDANGRVSIHTLDGDRIDSSTSWTVATSVPQRVADEFSVIWGDTGNGWEDHDK